MSAKDNFQLVCNKQRPYIYLKRVLPATLQEPMPPISEKKLQKNNFCWGSPHLDNVHRFCDFMWRSPLYVGCSFCQTTLLVERIPFIVDYRLKNNLVECPDFVTAKNRRLTHRLTYKGGPILKSSVG